MNRIIFHIDVNSAFLSWSALSLLEKGSSVDLRKIPAVIGGDMKQRHGLVLAKSIPAKKYGIVTGEPIVNAMRKCSSLVLNPPDHTLYQEKSSAFISFLTDFCPDIEQVSIDECYMDYTSVSSRFPSPAEGASYIKNQIKDHFGFTVNIGISDKKVLAKMASDFKKPDLVHILYSSQIREKLWSLPVSSLYMCGKSTVSVLNNLEIKTIGDLAGADKQILVSHLKSHGLTLWEYANGIDDSPVISTPSELKGIGNSTTLPRDAVTSQEAFKILLALAESVGSRLRHSAQAAGMVSVEIKYSGFKSVSHQTTLFTPSSTTQVIYETACLLFEELWDHSPVRLLGIRTSKLVSADEPSQLSLFDLTPATALSASSVGENSVPTKTAPSKSKFEAVDKAIDEIREKFGENAVMRGSLLNPKNKPKR